MGLYLHEEGPNQGFPPSSTPSPLPPFYPAERTKKTGVSGQTMVEAQFINRSLSFLEQVRCGVCVWGGKEGAGEGQGDEPTYSQLHH